MSIVVTPFLRKALFADVFLTGVAAVLMMAGAGPLAPLLQLPAELLFWSGAILVPFVAMLVMVGRSRSVPKLLLVDIVVINGLWVVASVALLVSGLVAPNTLGIAFVLVQAITVAILAERQLAGLRGAPATA